MIVKLRYSFRDSKLKLDADSNISVYPMDLQENIEVTRVELIFKGKSGHEEIDMFPTNKTMNSNMNFMWATFYEAIIQPRALPQFIHEG